MSDTLRALRERLVIDVLRYTPKGALSHLIGWSARRKLPRSLRAPLYSAFAHRFGADLDEVEQPLADYPRFNDFFTRKLIPGARRIDTRDDVVVSPCDGTVAEFGPIQDGKLIQCKGREYSLHGLLADADAARQFEAGTFCTIYLAPRDYHRVHAPYGGRITGYHHLPGAFFPVNPPSVRHVDGLFTINERIVTYVDTSLGSYAQVMVAATGVGHMTMVYDAVETHRKRKSAARVRYGQPRPIGKGDELGAFNLGSTVVLVWEKGRIALGELSPGQKIRLGQPLARKASRKEAAA